MESRRFRLAIAGLIGIGVLAGGALLLRHPADASRARPVPGERDRLVVEVLNGSPHDGLARVVTQRLRAGGIDVVYYGTAAADTFAATVILVRRGDPTRMGRVQEVLGFGVVAVDEDPALLVDASVYVGGDAAAALGFHP